ncbi:MAG TPA: hypothetical protein VKV39_14125 [Candidatus Sulfotelmatobacter sp.]|nr:hypothetical protein [Candidatus Sulfotelmatobacter sp.]
MVRPSPTAEGFRAAARRPSFTLAEISWRWTAGATAIALFFFGLFEYLDSLPVTKADALFLKTRHPYLVSQALAHILHGSMPRAVAAALLAGLLFTLLWIAAASLGRAATVRSLVEYFRRDTAGYFSADSAPGPGAEAGPDRDVAGNVSSSGSSIATLLRLNFLRAGVVVAAVVGLVGAAILAGFASPDSDPQPGLAFLLFLFLSAMVALAWWAVNWTLSLAAVFAVRDGGDTLSSISAAVSFCRERMGAVFAVTSWTGLAHLVAFVGATMVVSFPIGLAGLLPGRLIVLSMALVSLGYFVVADWLYMARLAGYVYIAEMPEALLRPAPLPPVPVLPIPHLAPTAPPLQTTIDKDEPILSDVPNPAVET